MVRRIIFLCVLASAGGVAGACVADGPLETAKWIYARQKDFSFQGAGSKDVRPILSPRFRHLLEQNWKCERKAEGLCAFDWDPWTDAQDGEILGPVRFETTASSATKATVKMAFRFGWEGTNDPKPIAATAKLKMLLDQKAGCWVLDDLIGREGRSLKTHLAKYSFHGS